MIDIFISPSSLDEIQLCWRRYQFSRKRRLVPFKRPERMEKGTVGHKILAYYYTEMGLNLSRELPKLREQVIEESLKIGTLEAAKTELGTEMLHKLFEDVNLYFQHFAREDWLPLLDDKRVPLVEVPLTKVLFERADTEEVEGVRVIFNGIIDLLLAPRKGVPVTIVDHKFKDRFSELDPLSNQLSLYSATTGIKDVLRNDIGGQKEGNVNKFRRQSFRYDKSQQDENLRWAIYWALEANYHESVNIYPPNPTSCDKFGGCLFSRICNTMPANREAIINANFKTGTSHSIYEDPDKPSVAVLENRPERQLGTALREVESPNSLEAPTETVPALRSEGGAVGDSEQVQRDNSGLDPVQVVPEEGELLDDVRDEQAAGPGSSLSHEDNFANDLLKRLE